MSIAVIRFRDQALSHDNLPASDTVTVLITDRLLTVCHGCLIGRLIVKEGGSPRAKVARSLIKRNVDIASSTRQMRFETLDFD